MVKDMTTVYKVLFLIAIVIFGPFAMIWMVNTLFNSGIGYTFNTYVATWAGVFILNEVTKRI